MAHKKVLSLLLSIAILLSFSPAAFAADTDDREFRKVYLHAQGKNPTVTPYVSTVYTDETAEVYLAVDNPNKGRYENNKHLDPQYDMNGYTVKIYFDPQYFDFADVDSPPIDYTVPDENFGSSGSGSENVGDGQVSDVPQYRGYYPHINKSGYYKDQRTGKVYRTAYATIFFSGGWIPQEVEETDAEGNVIPAWYNICKLPLKPINTGSTDVFIDLSGNEDNYTLELFAKNETDELSDQTFKYSVENGGYHHIIIKDKLKPLAPIASPPSGTYDRVQSVKLEAEDGCEIYYSLNGGEYEKYKEPIDIEVTGNIKCYAKRISDNKESDTVTYTYEIVPEAPYLFDEDKKDIPNNYNDEYNKYIVYVSDKKPYGKIDDTNDVYYTFSNAPLDDLTENGSNPESEWVKLAKGVENQTIEITKYRTVRLVTKKGEQFSDISWYYLGIKPADVAATPGSQTGIKTKIDIELSTETDGAEIFYTIDGSDPIKNGIPYDSNDKITISKDKTIRAVARLDGVYGNVTSYYYLFDFYDDYGVDAFYPSGEYEGSVNVTLTANNPENSIEYSKDGGKTWIDYDEIIPIHYDTDIIARAVDKDGNAGDEYKFSYKIKPLPPEFVPESTQFTNADSITVYCVESTADNTQDYELFYTTDGSDPITNGILAPEGTDSVVININEIGKYTVVSAVVRKNKTSWSTVVTHSYDIVKQKPVKPLTTLLPGRYTIENESDETYSTKFIPVPDGTDIYYTVSYNGELCPNPVPNSDDGVTKKYDKKTPIEIKGKTTIKAVAVNVFGVKSDIGIFEYTVVPQAPEAAPSAKISGNNLPVVPVKAVPGSTVNYEINGFVNVIKNTDGNFYINTHDGNAYEDEECQNRIGEYENTTPLASPAILSISAELNGVESDPNTYYYELSDDPDFLAPPYADKETGMYEEISQDEYDNLLYVNFYSLNNGDTIQFKYDYETEWKDYDGQPCKLNEDKIIQLRSVKGSSVSEVVSYVYNFIPLPPIITLESGRYTNEPEVQTTKIIYDPRAPKSKTNDKNKGYVIYYRANGDDGDSLYNNIEREIKKTMSFKAYVENQSTKRVSKSTIHYYIIESDNLATGSIYIANPYNVKRISADVLNTGDYADGIKLHTNNRDAIIKYSYSYTKKDGTSPVTNTNTYDNAAPIMVNSSMEDITIYAYLVDKDGNKIDKSDFMHSIDFIHLKAPVTSLGSEQIEFSKGTEYTIINDYPDDPDYILYYTLDGSDPADPDNDKRNPYKGEPLKLESAVTVKAVYYSACGKCNACDGDNPEGCWNSVYGKTGVYKYTVPTIKYSGGGGGGFSGRTQTVDNTRKYTKDMFGYEHPTHIGYIKGYPDGSVKPDGNITREEMAAILYRIKNRQYEKPFETTGKVFPDVTVDRWSVTEIEYMEHDDIIEGYPDGEFKPERNLTRAEFAALICRFVKLERENQENEFPDLADNHWAADDILALYKANIIQGYEDDTFRPERQITRAEVMTVVNKILGRNPSEPYVKSLGFNPFNDLFIEKWYYTIVLEATITHNYYLDDTGFEIKWEDCK